MAGNPITELKWTKLETSNNCPRPRHGHRAVAIKNQIIVFGGGNVGIIDGVNVYNTETHKWSSPTVSGTKPQPCAAYGLVVDYERNLLFMFGGMLEFGRYSNSLYMLNVSNWEWKLLQPLEPKGGKSPCPRLGHSFTLIEDKKAVLFGGLANDGTSPKNNIPRYLNDIYLLNLKHEEFPSWEIPRSVGLPPSPRESHTAVYYSNKRINRNYVVIYGGMSGRRLGDLWLLNTKTMCWSQPQVIGIPPLPRSLHTAALIGKRMFIFGGWVPVEKRDKSVVPNAKCDWECTNMLSCLNLENMTWENVNVDVSEHKAPPPRAGHCMVGLETRLYLWSGRDGYRKSWKQDLVCFKDMWFIEVVKPQQPGRILLQRSMVNRLEMNWECLQSSGFYLLQLQKYTNPPTTAETAAAAAEPTPALVPVNSALPQSQPRKITQPQLTSTMLPVGTHGLMHPVRASAPVIKTVSGNIIKTHTPQQQQAEVTSAADQHVGVVHPMVKAGAAGSQAQGVFSVAVNPSNQGLQISESIKSPPLKPIVDQQPAGTAQNIVSVAQAGTHQKPMAKQIIIKSSQPTQVVKTISMSNADGVITPVSLSNFQVQTQQISQQQVAQQVTQQTSAGGTTTQVGFSPSGRLFKIVKAIPKSNLIPGAKTITTKPGTNPMKIIKVVGNDANRSGAGNVQVTRTISGQPQQLIKMINPSGDSQNQNLQFVSRQNPVFVVTTGTNLQNIQTLTTSQANINKDGGQATQVIMSSNTGTTKQPLTLTVPSGQKTINIPRGQPISGQIVAMPSHSVNPPQRVIIGGKMMTLMSGQKILQQKLVLPVQHQQQQATSSAPATNVTVTQSSVQQQSSSTTDGPQKFMIFRTKPSAN